MSIRRVGLVLVGVPVGAALTIGLKSVLPLMEHLPAGGARCVTCHDLHGAVTLDGLRTDVWIRLTGDVAKPAWVETARLFGTGQHRTDGLKLLDLLADHACTEFRRVVLLSADGGHVSIEAGDVSDTTLLVPHMDAVRLIDDRLPPPAWLHSVVEICVVADGPALQIGDARTTFGELLSGSREQTLTEPTRVARKDPNAGFLRHCVLSHLVEGVRVGDLVDPAATRVIVTASGRSVTFAGDELRRAILCRDEPQGRVMLALPDRRPDAWLADVSAVCWH